MHSLRKRRRECPNKIPGYIYVYESPIKGKPSFFILHSAAISKYQTDVFLAFDIYFVF